MTTDRKLLELAAKAAGIDWNGDSGYRLTGQIGATNVPMAVQWNPRDDDGDSRRLEVKLKIELSFYLDHVYARQAQGNRSITKVPQTAVVNFIPEELFASSYAPDVSQAIYQVNVMGVLRGVDAAARLAVLRAAAEIGRAMP